MLIFVSTHLLARLVGLLSFNMVELGDHSKVNEDNYVPVAEEKLKEDQKQEYLELAERFKRECLKSYNVIIKASD